MTQDAPILPTESAVDAHLRVDGITRQLKQHSARGGVVMIISYAVQLVIGVGGMAVLARLLVPDDFGYLAMVTALITFVMIFREFLLTAAVYAQELTHAQASGLFWINVLASIAAAVLVAASAPILSWFFHEHRVLGITLVMSVGVLVNMLGMMHMGLLRRQMKFLVITWIEVGAVVAGAIAGIGAALLHAGYWALVWQQMALWIWQTAAAWWFCSWRPAAPRDSALFKDPIMRGMLRYGQDSTISRVLTYVSRNFDIVLVGYFFDAATVGIYQKANQWALMPVWQMYLPMGPVVVSSFSRLQNDPQRYRNYVRTTFQCLFGITLPAIALLLVEADNVILFLMGRQWTSAIPLLQILCVASYFSLVMYITAWLYLPEGRTAEQLRFSRVFAPLMILGIFIGTRWGIARGAGWGAIGAASGYTIASVVLSPIGLWYCLRCSPVTMGDISRSIWRATIASIVAAMGLWALRYALPVWPAFIALIVGSLIYGALYVILWLVLPGGLRDFVAMLQLARELRGSAQA